MSKHSIGEHESPFLNLTHHITYESVFLNLTHNKIESPFLNLTHHITYESAFLNFTHHKIESPFLNLTHHITYESAFLNLTHHKIESPCYDLTHQRTKTLAWKITKTHLCIVSDIQSDVLTVADITELDVRLSARTGHTHRCTDWKRNVSILTLYKSCARDTRFHFENVTFYFWNLTCIEKYIKIRGVCDAQ